MTGLDTFEVSLTIHLRIRIKGKQTFIIFATFLRSEELALVSLDYMGQES